MQLLSDLQTANLNITPELHSVNVIIKSGFCGVLVIPIFLLVLTLNVFTFLTIKQDMDYFAEEMIFSATAFGKTNGEVDTRYSELIAETGLTPTINWETNYFNASSKTVQYGDTITVTMIYPTYVKGFGVIKIPITLVAKHSGLSQKYWK